MFKTLYIIFLSLLFMFTGNTQEISYKLIDSISFPKNTFKNFIGIDTYENYYFSAYETITKYNKNQQSSYTNYELGIPTSISILNPLQLLLFYKETNTIILLDKFLNETQRIDLNTLTPPKIIWWAENTKNQQAWLFNGETNQLEFFNYQTGLSLAKSIPFTEVPISFTANFNTTYVLFPSKICSYTIYGTQKNCYTKNIEYHKLSVSGKQLITSTENSFCVFSEKLTFLGCFKKPKNNIKDFSIKDEKLYIYSESTIYIYQLDFLLK